MAGTASINEHVPAWLDVPTQVLALRAQFDQAVAQVNDKRVKLLCRVETDSDRLKKGIAVGVARCVVTQGIDLVANDQVSIEAFCNIIAAEVMAALGKEPVSAFHQNLRVLLQQPFDRLCDIAVEMSHRGHSASEVREGFTCPFGKAKAPKVEEPRSFKPLAIVQRAIEPRVTRSRGVQLSSDQYPSSSQENITPNGGQSTGKVINLISDEEDEESESRVFRKSNPTRPTNADIEIPDPSESTSDCLINLIISDPSFLKQVMGMNLSRVKELLNEALKEDSNLWLQPRGKIWIIEAKFLPLRGLELQTRSPQDVKYLASHTTWTRSFKEGIASLRKSHKVLMRSVSATGKEHSRDSRIRDLFASNANRLKKLASCYDIKDLVWHAPPNGSSGAKTGVIVVDFAFGNVAKEAIRIGLLWDGQLCLCQAGGGRKRVKRVLAHQAIENNQKSGHYQRLGHAKKDCAQGNRCSHCSEPHKSKKCPTRTKKCGLCSGTHAGGAIGCPGKVVEGAAHSLEASIKEENWLRTETSQAEQGSLPSAPDPSATVVPAPAIPEKSLALLATSLPPPQPLKSVRNPRNRHQEPYRFSAPVQEHRSPMPPPRYVPPQRISNAVQPPSVFTRPSPKFGQPAPLQSFPPKDSASSPNYDGLIQQLESFRGFLIAQRALQEPDESSTLKRKADENAVPSASQDRHVSAKRARLEEVAREDGVAGLWVPR